MLDLTDIENEMEILTPGTNVWWDDPDDGICSGWYKVEADLGDTVMICHNNEISGTEVPKEELTLDK